MRYFEQLAQGVDVLPLYHAIIRQPTLWNRQDLRTTHPETPHKQVSDIWIRFNDMDKVRANVAEILDEHESIWQPAAFLLPQCRPIIFDLMRRVEGERLGRVLITRLGPGGSIDPHVDGGDHAAYYERHHVILANHPGSMFYAGSEEVFMPTGSVWWFDNAQMHSVVNHSAEDRLTMIVDIRTLR